MEGGRDPERQKGRGGEALRGPGTHQQKYSWDENICCTQGARRGVHSGPGAPEPCQNQSRRVGIRVSRSQDGGFVLRTRTSLGLGHWTEGNSHRKSEEKGSNQWCKHCPEPDLTRAGGHGLCAASPSRQCRGCLWHSREQRGELSGFQLFRKINKAPTAMISGSPSPRGGVWGFLVVNGGQYHLAFLLHFSSVLCLRFF